MDVSLLPASAQAQMAALSIDSGVISSLMGTPATTSSTTGLFATPAVTVDISAEAQQAAAAAAAAPTDPEAAPGPGWEVGYDQDETGWETGAEDGAVDAS